MMESFSLLSLYLSQLLLDLELDECFHQLVLLLSMILPIHFDRFQCLPIVLSGIYLMGLNGFDALMWNGVVMRDYLPSGGGTALQFG